MKTLYQSVTNLESKQHSCDIHKQNFVNLFSPLMCNTSKQGMISHALEDKDKVYHDGGTVKVNY
jgi:hypothetical protein